MAVCDYCEKDMLLVDSCIEVEIKSKGKVHKPIPYGKEEAEWKSERCHDCNAKRGGFHHPGCDVERCPICGGQLISCGCLEEEDECPQG